jgi:hypothetical protein
MIYNYGNYCSILMHFTLRATEAQVQSSPNFRMIRIMKQLITGHRTFGAFTMKPY